MERTENKCPVTSNMGLSPMVGMFSVLKRERHTVASDIYILSVFRNHFLDAIHVC